MNDDKFSLLQATASEITKANIKYERLLEQRRSVTREVEAANSFFDKALGSDGKLDVTIPQRRVLESLALMADCEKRLDQAREELIDACACFYAEGFFGASNG